MLAAKERKKRKREQSLAEEKNRFWPDNWKFFVSAFVSIAVSLATVFITLYYELWRTEHKVLCSFAGSYFDSNGVKVRLVFENLGTESEVILGAGFSLPDDRGPKHIRREISGSYWDEGFAPMIDDPFILVPGESIIKDYSWPISIGSMYADGRFTYSDGSKQSVDLEISFLNPGNNRSKAILSGLTLSCETFPENTSVPYWELGNTNHYLRTNCIFSSVYTPKSIDLFDNPQPITFGFRQSEGASPPKSLLR